MDKLTHIQNTGPENKNKQVDGLYQSIEDIIQTARTTVYRAANFHHGAGLLEHRTANYRSRTNSETRAKNTVNRYWLCFQNA